jgi:hypothetical protein
MCFGLLAPVRECTCLAGLTVHHGRFLNGAGTLPPGRAEARRGRGLEGAARRLQSIALPSAQSTGVRAGDEYMCLVSLVTDPIAR